MRKTLLLVVATFVLVACDETSWGKSRAHKASEAGCRIVKLEEPLNGRMLEVGNQKAAVLIAPQQGGRLMGLRAVGGPEFLRNDADFTQANDSLGLNLGGAWMWVSLVESAAEAEILANGPAIAAVQWKTEFRSGDTCLTVTRRAAVRQGTSAVFFEATVLNRGPTALPAVTYQMQLRLLLSDDIRCEAASETLNQDMLKKQDLHRTLPAGATCRIRRDNCCLTVRPQTSATLALAGMQYMFRLEHATPPQDLPPGGTLKLHVVWQFANDKETVVDPLAFDWSVLPSRGEKVEPLIVRDTPPADLPRTRLAEKHGYYGLNVNSGCSFMPLWAAAGAEWLRANQFEWRKVEAQPGQFDFSSADKTVDAAERMGMQTFAVIHRTPAWAARHGSSTDPPKDLSVWGRYIETLVHRYRERVHVWEIWNEPDIDEFWSGSAQDYVDLLRTAYAAAKRADPKCLVMSAGPDGPGENFLQQIVQLGAANYCDLIGFHPYGALPEGPEKRMRAVWRILNFYHVKKPVWATEVGWQAGGWNGGWNVGNEEAKARCLTEGFQRLRPWAEVVCWYVDIEPNHVFGLAEPRGTHGFELNPAYFAFQRAAGSQKHSLPVRVELPASVRAPAGKSTILRGRITNTGQRPLTLTAEVVGLAPEQLRLALKPDPLAGGQSRELELAVAPPPYLRAGKNALLVAFFSEQQLVGKAWLTLDVANDEPFRDFTLSEGWVQRVDVNGKDVAAAFPQDRFALAPGQAFRQSLTLENVGAADDTFVLTLEGPAAAWVAAPMKTKEIRVPAGKKTWIPLEVRIPMDASPGTHALRAIAASRTYPDLRRQCIIDVNIGATQ